MSVTFKGTDFSVPISFGVGMYSDGTHMVKTDQWDAIVKNADTMVLKADSISSFVVGMYLADAVRHAGGYIETLILPYLPGARQDRSNPTGDVLFTAKSVADDINRREFSRVVSVDPHSPVMPSLINNFDEYPLNKVYERLLGIRKYDGVIAPDKGAVQRASTAAQVLSRGSFDLDGIGISHLCESKTRDVSTGKITGFEVPDLTAGAHYSVVDDICDGGGTFLGLGEKINEQGATADLFVTHGIFSKGTRALRGLYSNIYTTNTREQFANGLNQIDLVNEMENY